MSSTYRILCLSHDPATDHGEYRTAEAAAEEIAAGIDQHPNCDLVIGRYSYPLVAVGCPATRHQSAELQCHHGGIVWTEAGWLRLLAAGHRTHDETVQAAVKDLRAHCWPWQRLRRLRQELDNGTLTLTW